MVAVKRLKFKLSTYLRPYFLKMPLSLRLFFYGLTPDLFTPLGDKPTLTVRLSTFLSLRKYQIIHLVRRIIENSDLNAYAELWAVAGFSITPNYLSRDYKGAFFPFSEKPMPQQVAAFHIPDPQLQDRSVADKIIDLVQPIVRSGGYRHYFDLWARAGFHITPNPPPPLHNSEFKPNLFVLGAAKAGTTSIYAYLEKIPEFCMSLRKEPFFFEAEYELGLEHYRLRYFPHWFGQPIIGEARHRNLYLPYVPPRIHAVNPDAKLIVCVRNPIERAYSHWFHNYSRQLETLNFEQAVEEDLARIAAGWTVSTPREMEIYKRTLNYRGINAIYRTYIDTGYYYEQIARYLKYFPVSQIKVILLDDLQRNPFNIIQELQTFIGVEHYTQENFVPIYENRGRPQKGEIKQKSISSELRSHLIDHYQSHNEKLAQFLGRDLSHWR